ncbi:hypothetical protein QTO34_008009 [Cnephaeus nilssonii]|uniref:Uncharacterized protein n=1 Tax=Cnephaeus nilssonii TaxID=3371016 RepID=A0AA40I9P1_CNENI|nr:hypothetical protein QTO34_008009 [Eptesicus nilssonii]
MCSFLTCFNSFGGNLREGRLPELLMYLHLHRQEITRHVVLQLATLGVQEDDDAAGHLAHICRGPSQKNSHQRHREKYGFTWRGLEPEDVKKDDHPSCWIMSRQQHPRYLVGFGHDLNLRVEIMAALGGGRRHKAQNRAWNWDEKGASPDGGADQSPGAHEGVSQGLGQSSKSFHPCHQWHCKWGSLSEASGAAKASERPGA